MKQHGRGHLVGRGYKVSKSLERRLFQLYCQQDAPGEYLYSLDEIARMLEIDPKSARKILREEAVNLISSHTLNQFTQPNVTRSSATI